MSGWVTNWNGTPMNPEHTPTPTNPPELTKPTKIRSRGGFCLKGEPIPADVIVIVERHVAVDLVARRKAELVA